MEESQVTGKADELKGKVKQGIGNAVGDHGLEAEGVKDEVKGKIPQGVGEAVGNVKKADSDVNDK